MTHRRVIAACSMLAALVLGYGTGCAYFADARAEAKKDVKGLVNITIQDAHGFLEVVQVDLQDLSTNKQAQADLIAALIAAAAK